MGDIETANDKIFIINEKLKEFFLKYRPNTEEITKKGEVYYEKIKYELITENFKTLVSETVEKIIKPIIEENEELKKVTNFLLVDGLNLYYRIHEDEKIEKSQIKNNLKKLFNNYYPNTIILIVSQKHNDFFKDLQGENPKIIFINEEITSKSEIDDLLLVYLYFYTNVLKNTNSYVLSFDNYNWLGRFSQENVDETFFVEQPKLFDKLKEQLNMHNKNLKKMYKFNSMEKLKFIMDEHNKFIEINKKELLDKGRLTKPSLIQNNAKKRNIENDYDDDETSIGNKFAKASGKKKTRKKIKAKKQKTNKRQKKNKIQKTKKRQKNKKMK